MSEYEFLQCLKGRYGGNDYALIPQVRNATGFAARTRTADALAVSLWPSRGIGVEGFEFKDSRTDWKRELDNPAKAEEIARYCSAWWVVVSDAKIVHDGELPATWGLMLAADGNVKVLSRAKQPPAKPQEPSWPFIAAVLRAAALSVVPETEVEKRIKKEADAKYTQGHKDGMATEASKFKYEREQHDQLRKATDAFERTSGVRISTWSMQGECERIGKAVKLAMEAVDTNFLDIYERGLERGIEEARKLRAELATMTRTAAA